MKYLQSTSGPQFQKGISNHSSHEAIGLVDGTIMILPTVSLPLYRLRRLRIRPGTLRSAPSKKSRRKAAAGSIPQILNSLGKIRAGSKFSRIVRHILEKVNIKALLGGNLALFVVLSGIAAPGATAITQADNPEIPVLVVAEQPLTTEITIQYPVKPIIVNQGYNLLHWGVDFDGVEGDPIRSIKKGRVVRVDYSRFAYGNSILIDHGQGLGSLYAHLSRINVREGDEVDANLIIGRMGSTGYSTGDHLHLEVYKNGRPVNPFSILPKR